MKKEFKVIADLLNNNTRVLDVGCGDGSLMSLLQKEKNIEVRGLELDNDNVQKCIVKGLTVIQGDAETELHQFPDNSFDCVVFDQAPDEMMKSIVKGSMENQGRDNITPLWKITYLQFCDLFDKFSVTPSTRKVQE